MDKILEVAKQSGAQAIHPGYGFMSESTTFAAKVHDHGLVFIGPPAEAIRSMGSKRESKEIMIKAGVPCVPSVFPLHLLIPIRLLLTPSLPRSSAPT